MMVLGSCARRFSTHPRQVSILLVMDDGLGACQILQTFRSGDTKVSILLVMDDGLGVLKFGWDGPPKTQVSILLVMDDGLGALFYLIIHHKKDLSQSFL